MYGYMVGQDTVDEIMELDAKLRDVDTLLDLTSIPFGRNDAHDPEYASALIGVLRRAMQDARININSVMHAFLSGRHERPATADNQDA